MKSSRFYTQKVLPSPVSRFRGGSNLSAIEAATSLAPQLLIEIPLKSEFFSLPLFE
jgi:hypothetical protein